MLIAMAPSAGIAGQGGSSGRPTSISGLVHEPPPTEATMVTGALVEVVGASLGDVVIRTNGEGKFTVPAVRSTGLMLEFKKAGYQTTRVAVNTSTAGGRIDVAMMPEEKDVAWSRSGSDDCADLLPPPAGVPGLREYARFAVHHDGAIVVSSAQLPFFNNDGYVYRLSPGGWVKNEVDYVLLRTPVPVRAGFVYSVTFGSDKDLCGPWSVSLRHPS
jgi:hypothetical protein